MQSLSSLTKSELLEMAQGSGLDVTSSNTKAEIIDAIEASGSE